MLSQFSGICFTQNVHKPCISVYPVSMGAPAPRPLRSAAHPLGFPNLPQHDQTKVEQANQLYSFAVDVLYFLYMTDTVITIENPARSWLWTVLAHLVLQKQDRAFSRWFNALEHVEFSNCVHGGQRPKDTRLLSTPKVFSALAASCPGNHEHLPYTVYYASSSWHFDTAAEAEYPDLLCSRYAKLLRAHCGLPESIIRSRLPEPRIASLNAVGRQHRQQPQLIPEFKCIVEKKPPPSVAFKHLRAQNLGVQSGSPEELEEFRHQPFDVDGNGVKYGLFHTKEEFLKKALEVEHPAATRNPVPDSLRVALFDKLVKGPLHVAKVRLQAILRIKKLQQELSAEEARFQATLPGHVQEVVKGKNLLLWQLLLSETNFPDCKVIDLMKGVDLVGTPTKSTLFPEGFIPAKTTPALLSKSAVWRNKRTLATLPWDEDHRRRDILWEQTMLEVSKGYLRGPFCSEQELVDALGTGDFLINKRFLLLQGEAQKPRVIDDCKASGLNSAFTCVS